MKADEKTFLAAVAARCSSPGLSPRDLINEPGFPIHYKRAWFLLEKWTRKGWYNYGVTVDLGWLEPAGREAAKEISPE